MEFKFDGQSYLYPSRRRVVYARRGMVCTSRPFGFTSWSANVATRR